MRYPIIILICIFSVVSTSKAQSDYPNKNQVTLNTGISLTGFVIKKIFKGTDALKYGANAKAPIHLSYNRDLNEWFQLGLMGSRQVFEIDFEEYIDESGILQTGTFGANLNRSHLFLKASAFYRFEAVELYGGLRGGIVYYSVDVESDKLALEFIDKINGFIFPAGAVYGGIHVYLNDFVGFNAQLNIGAPHVLSGGLTVRF